MNVRWWREGDLYKIVQRPENIVSSQEDDAKSLEHLCRCGPAVTICEGEDPIMSMGVYPIGSHVGFVWAAPSDRARKRGLYVVRTTVQCLFCICYKKGYDRVHTTIPADRHENIKWIQLLGFEHEGTMEKAASNYQDLLTFRKFYGRLANEQTQNARARLQTDVAELFVMDGRFRGQAIP